MDKIKGGTVSLNIPLKLNLRDGIQTIAVVGDHHYPFQDKKVQELIDGFLEELQPNYLIYNGDLCDFYQVSVFAKDPSRLGELQRDINMVKAMFARHNLSLPNTRKIMIAGTHEYRFEKFLWSKAAELSSLSCLTIEQLYKLEDYHIQYIPFEQGLLVNKVFLVLHGDIASIHSAYTAKRHYEKKGGCGMCNHTHRGGSFYKTNRFGVWGWWENFCLKPDTLILSKDLNWKQLDSLSVGETIWGVDEKPLPGQKRKIHTTTITSMEDTIQETYIITLEDGREITVSADHRWLRADTCGYWLQTKYLKPGMSLRQLGIPWSKIDTYESGYLAGILDGEGWADGCSEKRPTLRVGFSQNDNLALDESLAIINRWGINYQTYIKAIKPNHKKNSMVRISGLSDSLNLIGKTRPPRLLNKISLDGVGLPGIRSHIKVRGIKPIGKTKLISINTDKHTLFANGLVSHNCTCSLDPDWIKSPDWQQGFSLVHFTDHKRFWVESIPIIDHAFLYNGRIYK